VHQSDFEDVLSPADTVAVKIPATAPAIVPRRARLVYDSGSSNVHGLRFVAPELA